MKTLLKMSLMGLLAGCASAGPPDSLPEGAEALRPAPSVYALIGEREELVLTSGQIEALDSIGEWVARANTPLTDQLEELGVSPMRPDFARRRSVPDEARPLLDQLQANNDRASAGVAEILTPEQESSVCEARVPRPGSRQAARRPEGVARDTLLLARRVRWDWCPAPGAASPVGS